MYLSGHAIARGQQRSIPGEVIELILAIGNTEKNLGKRQLIALTKERSTEWQVN